MQCGYCDTNKIIATNNANFLTTVNGYWAGAAQIIPSVDFFKEAIADNRNKISCAA
jgi:hypothetical protein